LFQSDREFLQNAVFQNKKTLVLAFLATTLFTGAVIIAFYLAFDRLFPFAPLVAQSVVLLTALGGLGQFFTRKDRLKKKYGENAYVHAFFRFHVVFIPFVYVAAIHPIFILPYRDFFNLDLFFYPRLAIASYLLLSAILLHRRTTKLFGLDNLFMYYVYHPERGVMVESVVHSVLRHPVYSAMMRLSVGLGILRGTPVSVLTALVLPLLNQLPWIYLFEEPDLLARFGESYRTYRRSVWALLVKPRDLIKFWKFLLGFSK
jgi:protein-S-isoprenylcysteine O-methyltransferase Ste14